ncbi:MAG: PKD domain-containing protein, partial [Sphingobacteriales bacterium]
GLFTVRLVVGNYGCYETLVMTDYIHVSPPIARFDINQSCDTPYVRHFIDRSIGADQWSWTFGDGATSTLPNPTHTYAATGTYRVSLTVKNAVSGCEHTDSAQVIIADEQALFSATDLILCRSGSTVFTAIEQHTGGITGLTWDFGDGTTSNINPAQHTYPLAGNYNVALYITDAAGCRDTLIKPNYIRVNGPTADFNSAVPGSCLLTAISFSDLSVTDGSNAITQWTWNYGDGNTATFTAPPFTHIYANQGTYSVSLLVRDAAGCADSIIKNNMLVISTPVAAFTTADTVSCPGASIVFTNTSTGPGLTYEWEFGDATTSTIAAPTHVYTTNGTYNIKLKIT